MAAVPAFPGAGDFVGILGWVLGGVVYAFSLPRGRVGNFCHLWVGGFRGSGSFVRVAIPVRTRLCFHALKFVPKMKSYLIGRFINIKRINGFGFTRREVWF